MRDILKMNILRGVKSVATYKEAITRSLVHLERYLSQEISSLFDLLVRLAPPFSVSLV